MASVEVEIVGTGLATTFLGVVGTEVGGAKVLVGVEALGSGFLARLALVRALAMSYNFV